MPSKATSPIVNHSTAEHVKPVSARGVIAVLGPTNTGKTHLAIEKMLGHETGIIGLPLRLLAREVYTKMVARSGEHNVALITGEEKIVPDRPRYWVSTVEAMPRDIEVDFVAIDEVQLAERLERGHIFTDRILNMRGRLETLLLGASTMRPVLEALLPGINVLTRPRMSQLIYSGSKKISRLPRRSAIVAFSAEDVYTIAELVRRQSGGTAVVLGSLSPRTRNAQVELFQNGDVDYLVATDAIGMGLNLDVNHVALASDRKFDGFQFRHLTPSELGQIAGRAGRYTRNGTFGTTSRVEPFSDDLVEMLESHSFPPVKALQWRTNNLDYSSLRALRESLEVAPKTPPLVKAPMGDDVVSLDAAIRDSETRDIATSEQAIKQLWDVCSLPDYRKISPAEHTTLVLTVYSQLRREGTINGDWLARQIERSDNTGGDIDTIAHKIAHIRTWTYLANRSDWVENAPEWQKHTRAVEERLSDALHEKLTQRFVDRRTSLLMKKMKEQLMLNAEITNEGTVIVEGESIGQIDGFRFSADANAASGSDAKTVQAAAQKVLAKEIEVRSERLAAAPNESFVLAADGALRWLGAIVAKVSGGEDTLSPDIIILADEHLSGPAKERILSRLKLWLDQHIKTILKPLFDLREDTTLDGLARGLAFQLVEAYGILDRKQVANDVKELDQTARGTLRKNGIRFGAYHIFMPALLKPAPASLIALLWGLKADDADNEFIQSLPAMSAAGRTSFAADENCPKELYRVTGFKLAGRRAVRIDILERLADLIRPLIAWKPNQNKPTPPDGALEEFGFTVNVAMTSLLGCSGEDMNSILQSLGYKVERREIKPELAPITTVEQETKQDSQTEQTSEEQENPSNSETSPKSSEDTKPLEPKFLEIWRPARSGGNRTAHGSKANSNAKAGGKKRPNQKFSAKKFSPTKEARSKPREKKADPDSPFAKLAALKATLNK